jgi:hypothetical protein
MGKTHAKIMEQHGNGKPIDSVIAVIDEGMKGRHGKTYGKPIIACNC